MKRTESFRTVGLAIFGLIACLSVGRADEPVAPSVSGAPIVNETLSLQGFGVQNPTCREWGDSCSICLRDDKDAPHCSIPGVACQPAAIACRQSKVP
jgi:hypothetical protein